MNVYRGPGSVSFSDPRYKKVASVDAKKLKESISENGRVRFVINTGGFLNISTCEIHFDYEDLTAIAAGLFDLKKKELKSIDGKNYYIGRRK